MHDAVGNSNDCCHAVDFFFSTHKITVLRTAYFSGFQFPSAVVLIVKIQHLTVGGMPRVSLGKQITLCLVTLLKLV